MMKRKSRLAVLLAAVLAITALFTGAAFATSVELNANYSDVEAALSAEQVQAQLVYNQLIETTTLADFFDTLMMEENNAGAWALNEEQLNVLYQKIQAMYAAIANPTADDTEYFEMLVETLQVIAEGNGVMLMAITVSEPWQGSKLTASNEYVFQNGAVITLEDRGVIDKYQTGTITIGSGVTLTIKGYGGFARDTNNKRPLFIVEKGGTLIIEGTSLEKPITMDGRSVIANTPLIYSDGTLIFRNAVIQNGKNRSVNADNVPNGLGGGIRVTSTGSLTMDNCLVTENTASETGGGIYCAGPLTITNSTISWNRAASAETGPSEVNRGRGAGINLTGAAAIGTLDNVIIEENAAMYYGGGVQVQNSASLTMNAGTIIRNNDAILHGAGGVHVTADAKFTMNGGSIENNTAQTVGGAIHSSYSCTLNLNGGTIKNNTANGRGGGVHVNTGGAITLGSGLTISGNRAFDQATGSYADMDATGDNWYNVKKEGAHEDNGYGGGVLIDSGTCTVAGATITDNYAAVGGGGIALVMLNVSEAGLDDILVVNFEMTSGVISGNTTSGNGAGVYLMSNKAKENIISVHGAEGTEGYQNAIAKLKNQNILTDEPIAKVSGGTISNNVADVDGGGLYLGEKTKFIIDDGAISQNRAIDGAGVYIASGTAEINGGQMSKNIASGDGGALYVDGTVNMSSGSVSANTAAKNGGAICVAGNGNFTMSNGSINENDAKNFGGAVYMAGGNFTMNHGNVNENEATKGGAVYMAGTTSIFTMESGTMNSNKASDDGGAIFAKGGKLYIGLEDCQTEDGKTVLDCEGTEHEHHAGEKHHPQLQNNVAADTGGGIAIDKPEAGKDPGQVWFYCGTATLNEALYKGVGKNVFMQGGEFHLYDGANIGVPRDPDLVIVGGKLHNECANKEYVHLYYYKDNGDTVTDMSGLAEYQEVMNLPDGEYFWDAPEGKIFIGWTAQGAASGNLENKDVRHQQQYVASGEPVQILDAKTTETDQTGKNTNKIFDGTTDSGKDGKIMHMYALWAPITNRITYVDGMTRTVIENTAATYTCQETASQATINAVHKPGYTLDGWYIYQDKNQNANWSYDVDDRSYEPIFKDGTGTGYADLNLDGFGTHQYLKAKQDESATLKVPALTFGNITLVANYIPAFADLEIKKTVLTDGGISLDNPSFIFKIEATKLFNTQLNKDDYELFVVISGNGAVTIKDLPVGEYKITEQDDWSWRYEAKDPEQEATLDNPEVKKTVEFENTREETKWLDGEVNANNVFNK